MKVMFRKFHGVGSQIAFSGSNFIISLTASFRLHIEDLSYFAVIMTATLWLSTLMNAWISFPYAMVMPRTNSVLRRSYLTTCFRSAGLLFSLLFCLFSITSLFILSGLATASVAIFVLVFLLRHEQRSALLAEDRPSMAFFLELSALFTSILCAILMYATGEFISLIYFLAIFIGSTAPSLVFGYILDGRYSFSLKRAVRRRIQKVWRRVGVEMTKGVALAEVMSNSYVYGLFLTSNVTILAVLYSSNILFRHIAVMSNGISNAIRPGFVRYISQNKFREIHKTVVRISIMMVLLCFSTASVLYALHVHDPDFLFSGKFEDDQLLLPIGVLTVSYVLVCIRMPAFIFLQSEGDLRFLTNATAFSAVIGGSIQLIGCMLSSIDVILLGIVTSNAIFTYGVISRYISSLRKHIRSGIF